MEVYYTDCQKCGEVFPEKEIQLSHDVPKYMGGTDSDGRHNLCKFCHEQYEMEVLKVTCMMLIKTSTKEVKSSCRMSAKMVQKYFFKKQIIKKEGSGDEST